MGFKAFNSMYKSGMAWVRSALSDEDGDDASSSMQRQADAHRR